MARQRINEPGVMGRPKKPIDWDTFEKLCEIQCTQAEMAGFFHIQDDTLKIRVEEHYGDTYQEVYKRFSSPGKCSLRRNQFKMSSRNATIAIWLGKQWLGQKEATNEQALPDEVIKPFCQLMEQIGSLQSDRKIAESNIASEAKSA